MLTGQYLRRYFSDCGVDPFFKLRESGLLSVSDKERMSTRDTAVVLMGYTAESEEAVTSHVAKISSIVDAEGQRFDNALEWLFKTENPGVMAVHICKTATWARIVFLNGNVWDFSNGEFKPAAIRHMVVIPGVTVSLLAMKIHHDTQSGWKEGTQSGREE